MPFSPFDKRDFIKLVERVFGFRPGSVAGSPTTQFLRGDGQWQVPTGSGPSASNSVVSETSFGQASAVGSASAYSRGDHTHGSPTNPVTAHEASGDPHAGYRLESAPIGTTDLSDNSVTYAKIQDVSAGDKLLGRISGAGDAEEIACTAAGRAIIDDADATAQRTTLGLGALATLATVGTSQIDNDAVTYAKIQNISATSRFLGRITAGAGDTEELTGTQATTLLDNFTTSLKGTVPGSGGGTTNFLRADGSWAAPPGGSGYATVEDEGTPLTQRTTINFVGAGVTASDSGGKTQVSIPGGAGASWTTYEADLGAAGSESWRGRFTITDAAISPSSKVIIQQAPGPYTGKGTRADEAEMDPLWCVAEPGSGQATVYWRTHGYLAHTLRRINGNQPIDTAANRPIQPDYNVDTVQTILGRVRGNVKFNYTVA